MKLKDLLDVLSSNTYIDLRPYPQTRPAFWLIDCEYTELLPYLFREIQAVWVDEGDDTTISIDLKEV